MTNPDQKEIKRYDEDYDEGGYLGITAQPTGDYLLASDISAEALEVALALMEQNLRDLQRQANMRGYADETTAKLIVMWESRVNHMSALLAAVKGEKR
jgi:hypothetical protein